MTAGIAPPTRIFRLFLAVVAAFAIAVVLPTSRMLADTNSATVSDEDGGKRKDKSSKKSDNKREKLSKDDDDRDDDDEDSSSSKRQKLDDDDSDDEDIDDDNDSDDADNDSDDEDADDDDDAGKGEAIARVIEQPAHNDSDDVQSVERAPKAAASAPVTAPATAAGALHPAGAYMGMADAIAVARKAGAQGDVLQIDLEYDAFRGFATCDVTFSSGTEYEMHAETGEILGSKQKDPAKLGLLSALATDSKSLKSFTDIIGHVSSATGQMVLEMELKHPKAAPGVIFEVVTADGLTTHFDAHTGKAATAP